MTRLNTKDNRNAVRQVHFDWVKSTHQNFVLTEYPEADCVIITYEAHGRPSAEMYDGTAAKPSIDYYYRSVERRQEAIAEHIASRIKSLAYREERKTANKGVLTGAAATAKAIRERLKAEFPEVKFSIKSDNFSGGNSVHISWMDGPIESLVSRITDAYQYGNFDGMTDCYNYHNISPDLGCPGSKYVSCSRSQSPERVAELETFCQAHFNTACATFSHGSLEGHWSFENRFPECWLQIYQDRKAANDMEDIARRQAEQEEREREYAALEKQKDLDAKIIDFAAAKKEREFKQEIEIEKKNFLETLPFASPEALSRLRNAILSKNEKEFSAAFDAITIEKSLKKPLLP